MNVSHRAEVTPSIGICVKRDQWVLCKLSGNVLKQEWSAETRWGWTHKCQAFVELRIMLHYACSVAMQLNPIQRKTA